jgi:hypothetical protein
MARVKTVVLNLRIEPALKKVLKQAAADDRRSLVSLIELAVIDYLKKRGYELPKSKNPNSTK